MEATQRVSRADLESGPESEPGGEDGSFDYGFDFDIVDVEEEVGSDSSCEEGVGHTFQLFSNAAAKAIEVGGDDAVDEVVGELFVDTAKRDAEWDQIAHARHRPVDYYVSRVGDAERAKFQACAVTGEMVWGFHLEQPVRLAVDAARAAKKVITNEAPVTRAKNKRGLQSRMKFKVYQAKQKEAKEAKRKQRAVSVTSGPSKKPFITAKPKFKCATPVAGGKPKFRTES